MIDTTNNTILTANAVIYKIENNEYKFLLVEEPDGYWGLPGGAKDVGDKDVTTALHRELAEELQISPDFYKAVKTDIQYEFMYDQPGSSRFGKKGVIHMFFIEWHDAPVNPSKELKSVAWLGRKEAIKRLTLDEIKDVFRQSLNLLINN